MLTYIKCLTFNLFPHIKCKTFSDPSQWLKRLPICIFKYILCKFLTSSHNYFMTFSSVQFICSVVSDSVTPWIAACQASLSTTNFQSSFRLMSIELVMPSSHLILCHPLLLLLPIPPSIRVFSSESTLRMRWLKYWSFSFSIIGMFILNYIF